MKTNSNQPIIALDRETLASLCAEVKETLALNPGMKKDNQHFGPADLWNIQRQGRKRTQRRNLHF